MSYPSVFVSNRCYPTDSSVKSTSDVMTSVLSPSNTYSNVKNRRKMGTEKYKFIDNHLFCIPYNPFKNNGLFQPYDIGWANPFPF